MFDPRPRDQQRTMPSADCAHLYAELLANIRQISLAAALPSPCDSSTRVAISADCQTVELKHRGSTCALKLPGKASLGGVVLPIQDKQHGSTSLEWRLPLDASSLPPANQADNTPWSATDLDAESGVDCRGCANNIVRSGSVKVWKDLPSGNWAEMMEFWHCHKPDHHHHHHDGKTGKAGNQSLAMRGYGASSSISARKGVGFVDLTTLLLDETDCQPLTVSCFRRKCPVPIHLVPCFPKLLLRAGIKKVARPACSRPPVAWIPIQVPHINNSCTSSCRCRLPAGFEPLHRRRGDPSGRMYALRAFAGPFRSLQCSGIIGGTYAHASSTVYNPDQSVG